MIDDLLNTDSQDHQDRLPVGCGQAKLLDTVEAALANRSSATAASNVSLILLSTGLK
jgi:hypothetical protein